MLVGVYASRADMSTQAFLTGLPDPSDPSPATAATGMMFFGGGSSNVTAYGWDAGGCMAFTAPGPVQNLCVGPGWEQNVSVGAATVGVGAWARTLYGWTSSYGEPVWVDEGCTPVSRCARGGAGESDIHAG
jgi:hypothetical protein